GGRDAQRRSGARRTSLCRSGQAEPGGRAFHLSCRRSQSIQRHLERRNEFAWPIPAHPSDITEGGKMNLLGKLSWDAIPFDQPIVMAATAGMVAALVLILGWV